MANNNLILIVAVVLGVFLLSGGITGNLIIPQRAVTSLQATTNLPSQVNALNTRLTALEATCAKNLGAEEYAELWGISNRLETQLEESGLPLVAGQEPGCVCVYSRGGVIGAYALCQACTQSNCAAACSANTPATGKGAHESGTCYEKLC